MTDTLNWTEMMWLLFDEKNPLGKYLGEAGNTSYWEESQIKALRFGDDVLVICRGTLDENIIPASTVVKGFGSADGKTLAEVMKDGVIYNYALQPVVQDAAQKKKSAPVSEGQVISEMQG